MRCAACGTRWTARAEPEAELELTNIPEIGTVAAEPALAPAEEVRPFPEALPKAYRAKVAEKSALRRAVVHGIIWATMAGALAASIAVSIIFRVEVVRLVPRAASAYAMAGLKVNAIGLTFEQVTARPGLTDGHTELVVSGVIRNIEGHAITSPALRINVLDKVGGRVGTMVNPIDDARIAAGGSHRFVISYLDPPPSAENVEVAFEVGGKTRPPAAHAAPAVAPVAKAGPPALRPAEEPEPVQAVPLPVTPVSTAPSPAPDPAAPKAGARALNP